MKTKKSIRERWAIRWAIWWAAGPMEFSVIRFLLFLIGGIVFCALQYIAN